MSKPIFPAFRQFLLSAVLRVASPRPAALVEPEPKQRDLHPENDAWMFDAPRTLSAHKADLGQAMGQLSNQLSSVRHLLSRMSPMSPAPADEWSEHEARLGASTVWSDTQLFDGEPAPITAWGESMVDEDMDYLFGSADLTESDLVANELFGGYGHVPALAS